MEDHGGRLPHATYLFVANHVNLLDAFLFMGFIPHFFRAVELRAHFSWPLYGLVIRRLGNIPNIEFATMDSYELRSLVRQRIQDYLE